VCTGQIGNIVCWLTVISKLSLAIKEDTAIARDALPIIQTDIRAIHDSLPTLQTNISAIRDVQAHKQHKAALNWLSRIEFTAQQHDIIKRREAGTGQWFTTSAEFIRWEQGHDKTLFCCGMPGAGKTMMAAVAIDHICTTAPNDSFGLGYVFCNYQSQADQSALGLLSALLRQLVEDRLDFTSPLVEMYNHHAKRKTRPLLDEVAATLKTVCLRYDGVYIIVDALDECVDERTDGNSGRAQFIREMRALQAAVDVRLLFTSRPIPEIIQLFKSDLMLEVRATKEDVQRFVASHISPKYDAHLKAEIVDKIATAADGM
jgi:hypothetical protein